MKTISKKAIMISTFLAIISGTTFLFFNATLFDRTLSELIQESNKIERLLNTKRNRSEASKGLLREHQESISNVIAFRAKAKSCRELIRRDKNLKTGIYTLYPNDAEIAGTPVFCNIEGRTVTEIAVQTKLVKSKQQLAIEQQAAQAQRNAEEAAQAAEAARVAQEAVEAARVADLARAAAAARISQAAKAKAYKDMLYKKDLMGTSSRSGNSR